MNTKAATNLRAGDEIAGSLRVGDVVADKYRVERLLGVGGMGVVVAARDVVLDRAVAIKLLLPKLAGLETAVQRFVREARAATRISSEHVVRLLEIEKLPSGAPFFVMEYLEGRDLRALLREEGPLASSRAVDFVLQALQAVAEGHVKGIVHRDIKPGNLFLTQRADGTPLIKVLDFGIAKTVESDAAESSLTSSDDVRLGSPAYMPPEQLQDPRDVDTRSDIWSLGATLYELLCGRPPFEAPSYLELATHILSQAPTPVASQRLPQTLPPGLETVLKKCLAKDRAQRYADAAALAAALAPYGTADARLSLSRVSGTLNASVSSSSLPALTTSVSLEGVTCDPTLARTSTNPDLRRTSNISALSTTPPAKPGRSWIVLAGAAAVLALVALQSPLALRSADNSAATATATVAAPQPSASPPRVEAPHAEAVSVEAPRVEAPPKTDAKRRTAVPARIPKNIAEIPKETAPPPAPPLAESGRSAEIERLIERRH